MEEGLVTEEMGGEASQNKFSISSKNEKLSSGDDLTMEVDRANQKAIMKVSERADENLSSGEDATMKANTINEGARINSSHKTNDNLFLDEDAVMESNTMNEEARIKPSHNVNEDLSDEDATMKADIMNEGTRINQSHETDEDATMEANTINEEAKIKTTHSAEENLSSLEDVALKANTLHEEEKIKPPHKIDENLSSDEDVPPSSHNMGNLTDSGHAEDGMGMPRDQIVETPEPAPKVEQVLRAGKPVGPDLIPPTSTAWTPDTPNPPSATPPRNAYDVHRPTCSLNLVCYRDGAQGCVLVQIHTILESRFSDTEDFKSELKKDSRLIVSDQAFFRKLQRTYWYEMCGFWRRYLSLKTLRGIRLLVVCIASFSVAHCFRWLMTLVVFA